MLHSACPSEDTLRLSPQCSSGGCWGHPDITQHSLGYQFYLFQNYKIAGISLQAGLARKEKKRKEKKERKKERKENKPKEKEFP